VTFYKEAIVVRSLGVQAILMTASVAALISSGCVKPQAGGNDEANTVYAVVNGQEIKGKDVMDKVPNLKNDLNEIRRNEYEAKKRATDELVQQRLVEDEAKKQGVSVDKLFSQFESLKDKEVSKDDIAAFLKQRNIDEKRLTKQEKDSVPQIIKMQRVYEARQKYVADLRSKANVQFKIVKPEDPKVDVNVGSGTPIGPTTAKVTIVEFSDFQCPFCSRGRQRVDEIKSKYGDKVKIYFRNFPLEQIHPQAFHAAEAAACALEQGKFWDYHNELFDHQSMYQEKDIAKNVDKNFINLAKEAKLDDKAFAECLKSGKHDAELRHDMEEAQKYGVNSTPTFFVNGRAVRGAQPIEAFSEIIDEELSKN
jgi:protein-disulfide isomerase